MSNPRLNNPAMWYHTPADMPDATNIMQACRLLADNIHSNVPVRNSDAVAALGAAADQIQRAEEALALAVAKARQDGAQEVLARVFPCCGGNDETPADHTADCTSARLHRRRHSPESIAKMSASHTGKTHTAETLAKMSASRRGLGPMSEEHRGKIAQAMTGKVRSPESCAKQSATMRAKAQARREAKLAAERAAEENP